MIKLRILPLLPESHYGISELIANSSRPYLFLKASASRLTLLQGSRCLDIMHGCPCLLLDRYLVHNKFRHQEYLSTESAVPELMYSSFLEFNRGL